MMEPAALGTKQQFKSELWPSLWAAQMSLVLFSTAESDPSFTFSEMKYGNLSISRFLTVLVGREYAPVQAWF